MPVKDGLYDMLGYSKQIAEIKRSYKKDSESADEADRDEGELTVEDGVLKIKLTNAEFLSGLRKDDKLIPIITAALVIAVCVSILSTIVIICVSYALSRMRFKGRTFLMRFWLVLGMFPGFLTMICLYFLLKQFGLTQAGAVPGLILIGVASSGMGYYVCKGYFDTLPIALDEAARIDGASRAKILFVMTLPLSKPIIIYTALVSFMAPWCDYVFASYVAFGHDSGYNVAVALQRWIWTNDYQGYFTRFCAGGILIAIPVTVLFMFLQKYYVEGVTGGAVKG